MISVLAYHSIVYYLKLINIIFSLGHELYLPVIIKLSSKKGVSTLKCLMKFDFNFENKYT